MAGSSTLESFMADLGELITKHFGDETPEDDLYEDEDEKAGEGESEEGDEDTYDDADEEPADEESEDEESEENEESEDEESEESDEDEEDEEEHYSRDELEEMGLRQLRSLARESGYSTSELKDYDKDDLISLLLGEEEEEPDE